MKNSTTKQTNMKFDGVIFDCDSTLSTIEGINELANLASVKDEVTQLTNQAMDGDILLEAVYEKRLELIKPSRKQIQTISEYYCDNIVTGAKEIIETLQANHVKVGIISGGLLEAILPLAISLGVSQENIFAVPLAFDDNDQFLHVVSSPLTTADGKYHVTADWKKIHQLQKVALIGDGMSDVAALGAADVVIGYGGVVSRQQVKKNATYFYEQYDLLGLLEYLQ